MSLVGTCQLLLLLLNLLSAESEVFQRRLNEYISHYEPLHYEVQQIRDAHARVRRSEASAQHVDLRFTAHGHLFHLRMKRDSTSFSDNLKVEDSNGKKHKVDVSHIYRGELLGDGGSFVFGSLNDGVFEGKIIANHGAYYMEKKYHYFPHRHNDTFHSVIYKEVDVNNPYEHLKKGHVSGCGMTDKTLKWMKDMQNSEIGDDADDRKGKHHTNSVRDDRKPSSHHTKSFHFESECIKTRQKRYIPYEPSTCSLYIQTDPYLWQHVKKTISAKWSNRKNSEINRRVREEILSLVAHHITSVNYIYSYTNFNGRKGIRFEVQRLTIHDDAGCLSNNSSVRTNQFCLEDMTASNVLNQLSLENHDVYCLAYLFTYRDFKDGILGLAWEASETSSGICQRYKTYNEISGGIYQSVNRSLNTGIVTFMNYQSRVPPRVSQLVFAHQIGHNFGSPHDYSKECRPGGSHGNYIMFPSATGGDRPNNSKFSRCSINNISNVLDAMVDNKKRNCFTASAGAFCGNKIVEAGEECDCGYDDEECTDKCCYPRLINDNDRSNNYSARGCQRRYRTQCSPSEGFCCSSETCTLIPKSNNAVCRRASDCAYSSVCDGLNPECPIPKPKSDRTRCDQDTKLCINGECSGSVCLKWNMTQCFLTSDMPNINKRKLCELACQNGSDTSTCRSSSEFPDAVKLSPGGISLRPGSPCDNYEGYCDTSSECQAVAIDELPDLLSLIFAKLRSLVKLTADDARNTARI